MKAKMIIILIICSSTLFLSCVFYNMFRFKYDFLTALERTVYFHSQTKWSVNFNEESFLKIRLGMKEAEVKKIMHQPIWKSCDHQKCIWAYATGTENNVDFDRRYLYFNKLGQVYSIQKDYYADW